jgi:hypothetical protein
VTTMDAAAARRRHPGVAVAVLVALAVVGIAGCESSSSLFTSNAPVPEPIKPAAPQPVLARVALAPIIGAPDAVAKQIQQDFAGAVEKQRIAVAAKDERADFTLRGYIVASKEKDATKVSYIWDITDPAGRRVNRIAGEEVVPGNGAKDPWAAVTPPVAQAMAEKAASAFAAWLPGHTAEAVAAGTVAHPVGVGAQPQEPPSPPADAATNGRTKVAALSNQTTGSISPPVAAAGAVAAIASVSGAPGDGATSLTAAIRQELANKGVGAAEKSAGAYRVEGAVALGPAKDGKQSIHIEWTVRDPAGKKLGTVSQRNEIPEGSLDGAWGKTAEQAAGAAAQGIVRLLPQSKAVN